MSKNYRKFVAGTVTAAVVASAIAPAASAASFSDVPADHQFAEAINDLAEKGIFVGKDGKFDINGELTRRQAAVVFARLIEGEGKLEQVFSDVSLSDEELTKAAYEVNEAGVMTGANGKLNPYSKLTRQQMAKIIVEHFDLEHVEGSDVEIKDLEKAHESQREYIQILAENGVTQVADGNFRPTETVKRGQFAAFVYRAMNLIKEVTPAVESVEAINGKQVEVKFATAVSVNTIMDENGKLKDSVAIDTVADAKGVDLSKAKAELSEDGKSLVITAAGDEIFKGKYAVTITGVKDVDGNEVEAFAGFFVAEDTTRPTVADVEYVDVNTAKIMFSEPVKTVGEVTVNNADAKVAAHTAGENFITVDLTAVKEKSEVEVTIVGAKDFAGNYISPNPVKVTVEKQEADKVAPEVKSVQVLSDTKAKVTFSEAVKAPTVKINGNAATKVEADEDGVTYTVTHDFADGVNKIEITGIEDKAGNKAEDFTKQVIVAVDTEAPELVSQKVEKVDGKEVLVLTYDEEVTVSGQEVTFEGKHVADYVTSTKTFKATPVLDKDNAKVVKVALADAVKGNWTVTLAEGFVTDTAQSKNKSEAEEITFVRGMDDEQVDPQEVAATIVDNGKNAITVTFNGKVNGASAVDTDNYAIEGVEVEKAVLTKNDDNGAAVELTLEEGSVKASGNYELTVSGVKAADGTAVKEVKDNVALVENVLPALQKAELVNGKDIVLTFSENMAADSIAEGTPVADFAVFVDGKAYEGTVAEAVGANAKEVKLTLGTALTSQQLAKAITIKPAEKFEVTDAAGNKHASFEVVEVTKAIN
ncbi:S-layer homology domain-containing protein [Priestia abyssalis]|uniref:S-layer homology domain-containing protein n=1 Tax=Priestia abyssalis TaxID=1221450 RepID=UPI0009956D0C|nr:S-layer homology domain-containing protein [Priestia abyssalis]